MRTSKILFFCTIICVISSAIANVVSIYFKHFFRNKHWSFHNHNIFSLSFKLVQFYINYATLKGSKKFENSNKSPGVEHCPAPSPTYSILLFLNCRAPHLPRSRVFFPSYPSFSSSLNSKHKYQLRLLKSDVSK